MTRTDKHIRITREAARRVAAVRDDPAGRLAMADDAYIAASNGRLAPFARAELAFIGWEIKRGVLDPIARRSGRGGGSRWWRTVNERLLRDVEEGSLLYSEGLRGGGSSIAVDQWVRFFAAPTSQAWYRAHNASIVSGYLEASTMAMRETGAERRLMNVILARALYAYMLASGEAPLGWMDMILDRVGRLLALPTGPGIIAVIELPGFYPSEYPMTEDGERQLLNLGMTVQALVGRLEKAVVARDLGAVYSWNAEQIQIPKLTKLLVNGKPSYPDGIPAEVASEGADASFVKDLDGFFEGIARSVLPEAAERLLLGDEDDPTQDGLIDLVRWRIGVSLQRVCFVSWEVPVEALRQLVPEELEIDEFEGKTYVTAVALETNVHIRGLAVQPKFNGFPELNFRTYVRHNGRPGIYFISVDATPDSAVEWAADNVFRLPYSSAHMNLSCDDVTGRNTFTSERTEAGAPATFHLTYDVDLDDPGSDLEPGTLKEFICKRDFAFSRFAGRVLRFIVRHPEWKTQRVESAKADANALFEAAGLAAPIGEPFVYYSRRSDGVMYPPVPW